MSDFSFTGYMDGRDLGSPEAPIPFNVQAGHERSICKTDNRDDHSASFHFIL